MGAGCAARGCPHGSLRAAGTLSTILALTAALTAAYAADLRAATRLRVEGAPGLRIQVPWHGVRPDQLLILVNSEDSQSVQVADEYMARYAIPAANRLDLAFARSKVMSSDAFEPLYALIGGFVRNRPDLQAIAITWTEPWRVSPPDTYAGMSITSAVTFGFHPEYYNSGNGTCALTEVSPLYGQDLSSPFAEFGLRPAMMIAGETAQDAIDVIDRGIAAKSSFPLATGYLVRTTDVFRSIRYGQMEDAVALWDHPFGLQLDYRDNSEGVPADNYVRDADDVLFYFTGLTQVEYVDTLRFPPGAVADHLTSSGGALTNTSQMSILRWLEAGATGSFGTVTEPCSSTDKFANVDMLMRRYFSGATLLDAYWQSVRMPGEGIFVGDPLAQPWATKSRINGSGQVELITTGMLDYHLYKLTGVNGDSRVVLLNGVHVDAPELRVLTVPAGFESYRLSDTGAMLVDQGAPQLTRDSVSSLDLPDGATRFHVHATDLQGDDPYYSFQLASGALLEQSEAFSASLVLDGDVNRDGYVNSADVAILRDAMGSRMGDARYLPEADLGNDGTIDVDDFRRLRANLGRTRPFVEIVSRSGTPTDLTIMAFDRWGSESRINARIAKGSFQIVP
jgi:uncharacterized protein (TIGR03790 family)